MASFLPYFTHKLKGKCYPKTSLHMYISENLGVEMNNIVFGDVLAWRHFDLLPCNLNNIERILRMSKSVDIALYGTPASVFCPKHIESNHVGIDRKIIYSCLATIFHIGY
jgi:hypothetical protein